MKWIAGLLPLVFILHGCATSLDSDASKSEYSIIRIYDPETTTVSEPMSKAYLYHAEWLPSGTQIITDTVGISNQVRLLSDIRLLDVTEGTITNLTNTPDNDEHSPQPSPDGTQIVYVVDNQLAVMTLSDQTVVSLNVSGFSPVWQPNGTGVAYEGNGIGYHNLTTATTLTTGYLPLWVDNTRLLIERISGDTGTLYLYNTGSNVASLVGEGRNADVSADATFVVYERDGDIYRTTLSGLATTLLITNATSPQLSPDDATLAYVRDGIVYTVPIADLGTRSAIGEGERPRWSADGKLLFQTIVYR
jgi:Tol biopolymer transport system component